MTKTLIMKSSDTKAITASVHILKNGGILVYPTETSYGLGCDATNERAVRKIFLAKKRGSEKFLPVIVSSASMAGKFYRIGDEARALIGKFMPGPLTLVAPKRKLPKRIGGFRISSGAFARPLARRLGRPVVATSANISGQKPSYSAREAAALFKGKVDMIIDGGNLRRRNASTIFNAETMEVLRRGPVTRKDIAAVLRCSSA
ncbi:MAG: threonylcarbamoyl-AMP synthase [Candidatus Aenigmarchaeota archaeon]|nr:threonylcarbamoyl-AMP synthase [Candidatus Aenigmarchaeota archaeon]